jgi:hypothetical protein
MAALMAAAEPYAPSDIAERLARLKTYYSQLADNVAKGATGSNLIANLDRASYGTDTSVVVMWVNETCSSADTKPSFGSIPPGQSPLSE